MFPNPDTRHPKPETQHPKCLLAKKHYSMSSRLPGSWTTRHVSWWRPWCSQRAHLVSSITWSPQGFATMNRPELLLEAGRRVRVPLGRGNRAVVGYCVAVDYRDSTSRRLKSIASVLDSEVLLTPVMLRLTRWMAEYYLCPWGQVLDAVLPAGVRHRAGTRQVTLLTVPAKVAARLTQLELPAKQAAAMQQLAASSKPLTSAQLASRVGCTVAPINTLRKKGLIEEHVERMDVATAEELTASDRATRRQEPPELHEDQRQALSTVLAALNSREHQSILLFGVTGSGKTEVYIQAIEEVVRFGRQAIVLVPEISLTPQTVARFRARFDRVAILHSHQSDAERHREWQRIARGHVEVVVGARSAVFAPTPNLGLIVMDEEHETTFKQEVNPRYHARDVAAWRARAENVPLVLGSATPSLESWHRAQQGDYCLVRMPKRVLDLPLPAVGTIDMRLEEHGRSRGSVSRPLHQAIDAALRDDGQVILLLNRRGFATHIQCPACGEVARCPNCDLSLTFHRQNNSVMCHLCDYETVAPAACTNCKFGNIRFAGIGTQKLEAEVRARFPRHEVLRMDTDTMRRPGSHQDALSTFREGRAHILLGTQMIAKGLDFPNVTLVGVINADTALHFPDFRAAERTFQLVTQVAGRSGRGPKGGRVLVQTFSPDHPAITAAVRHDYEAFVKTEIEGRRDPPPGYPPLTAMVRLIVRGESEQTTESLADELADRLVEALSGSAAGARLLGPAPAPIAKLRGNYRQHMLLQGPDVTQLADAVRSATKELKVPEGVAWAVDVDPVDML